MTDWRIWSGLGLAAVLGVAAVLMGEYQHVRVLQGFAARGWSLQHVGSIIRLPEQGGVLRLEPLPGSRRFVGNSLWFTRVRWAVLNERTQPLVDVAELARFRELQVLSIDAADPSRTDWEVVSRLESLESLHLTTAGIITDSLAPIRRLPHLRTVTLQAPAITEEALFVVADLPLHTLAIHSPVAHDLTPATRKLQSLPHVQLRAWDWQQ